MLRIELVSLYYFILLGCIIQYCCCGLLNIFNHNRNAPKLLLPQLPPHKDQCYLLEFIADSNNNCEQMEPVVRRLEDDLHTKVRRLNIQAKPEYMQLYEYLNGPEGGNLPFFYNRRSAYAVCGPTTYKNLMRWALGDTRTNYIKSLDEYLQPKPSVLSTAGKMVYEMMGGGLITRLGLKRAGLGTSRKKNQ